MFKADKLFEVFSVNTTKNAKIMPNYDLAYMPNSIFS